MSRNKEDENDTEISDIVLALERAIFETNSEGDFDYNDEGGKHTERGGNRDDCKKTTDDIETYELDFLNHSLLEEREENKRLRAIIKAKDFEISALRQVCSSNLEETSISQGHGGRLTGLKSQSNLEDMLRVQEQIEAILKEEIVHLKRVVRIQKSFIDKAQKRPVKRLQQLSRSFFDDGDITSIPNSITFDSDRTPGRSRSAPRLRSRSRSRSRQVASDGKEHYQYPTVASILHRGVTRPCSAKSSPMKLVEEEAMRILEELNIPLPPPTTTTSSKRAFR
jgi:hypothetical protein